MTIRIVMCGRLRSYLIICLTSIDRYSTPGEYKGNPPVTVGFCPDGRRMVGTDQNAKIIAAAQCLTQRCYNLLVNLLYCLNFFLQQSLMRCLIWRLNMDAYQIMRLQCFDRRASFCTVISVGITGRSRDCDVFPADKVRQASQKIDSSNHRSSHTILCGERIELWSPALSPQPDIGCRAIAFSNPGNIDRVSRKDFNTIPHPLV